MSSIAAYTIMSTTYSEGGSGSSKVKRTHRGDRESLWFGVKSSGTGPFVPKGNETGVCVVGIRLACPLDIWNFSVRVPE
jgi:hypothetical protein